METVLSLCDRTGVMVQPWAEAGYHCICVDKARMNGDRETEKTEGNITWIGADLRRWIPAFHKYAIVFAFPPCTSLTNSGNRWKQEKGIGALVDALDLVDRCRRICDASGSPYLLENPVGSLSSYWRSPDYTFDPCDYGGYLQPAGDAYTKKTCLWVGGGFTMPPRRRVEPVQGSLTHLMPPSDDRGDLRSVTPAGFAQAVFEANRKDREFSLLAGGY